MRRSTATSCILAAAVVTALIAALVPGIVAASPEEPFRWYGLGGEITSDSGCPRHWLARIGIDDQLGAEVLFALMHAEAAGFSHDVTRIDIGAGLIYDLAPTAVITPYGAARFILNITDADETDTGATAEAACGAEYAIGRRLGLSGELNLSLHTDPSEIITSTRVRFYFYF
ncbi:MAG: hypothetical protein WAW06_01025 [bacterium]